jgi:hypothetical protein
MKGLRTKSGTVFKQVSEKIYILEPAPLEPCFLIERFTKKMNSNGWQFMASNDNKTMKQVVTFLR